MDQSSSPARVAGEENRIYRGEHRGGRRHVTVTRLAPHDRLATLESWGLAFPPTLGDEGFSWGNTGAGAGSLALALLREVTGDAHAAALHQAFLRQRVAAWAPEGFQIARWELDAWVLTQPGYRGGRARR
jgi:hypothetical protein